MHTQGKKKQPEPFIMISKKRTCPRIQMGIVSSGPAPRGTALVAGGEQRLYSCDSSKPRSFPKRTISYGLPQFHKKNFVYATAWERKIEKTPFFSLLWLSFASLIWYGFASHQTILLWIKKNQTHSRRMIASYGWPQFHKKSLYTPKDEQKGALDKKAIEIYLGSCYSMLANLWSLLLAWPKNLILGALFRRFLWDRTKKQNMDTPREEVKNIFKDSIFIIF